MKTFVALNPEGVMQFGRARSSGPIDGTTFPTATFRAACRRVYVESTIDIDKDGFIDRLNSLWGATG